MKKAISVVLVCMLIISVCTCAFAEEADSFLFRSIPWYTAKKDAAESLSSLESYRNRSDATMPDWFQRWNNIDGDYTVANAGAYTTYKNVAVAGYKASLETYYVYPIVDGKLLKSDDDAEFYLAIYEFATLTDMQAVYDDLVAKLSGLYGDSSALNNPDNWTKFDGRLWKAKDGSQIWLRLYHMYGDYTLKLTYTAPNSTERLQAVEAQITKEKIEAEELERQKNTNNTDGL